MQPISNANDYKLVKDVSRQGNDLAPASLSSCIFASLLWVVMVDIAFG